ncbi:hypothetical protein HZC34_03400 [Candidatus Saganbacteria bacterium]|nr:hypothetical protein [Candidatus Saganbacteria bacterium]
MFGVGKVFGFVTSFARKYPASFALGGALGVLGGFGAGLTALKLTSPTIGETRTMPSIVAHQLPNPDADWKTAAAIVMRFQCGMLTNDQGTNSAVYERMGEELREMNLAAAKRFPFLSKGAERPDDVVPPILEYLNGREFMGGNDEIVLFTPAFCAKAQAVIDEARSTKAPVVPPQATCPPVAPAAPAAAAPPPIPVERYKAKTELVPVAAKSKPKAPVKPKKPAPKPAKDEAKPGKADAPPPPPKKKPSIDFDPGQF